MDLSELESLLCRYSIPFEAWGGNGGKGIEELLAELTAGESMFTESGGKLLRTVNFVRINVFYCKKGKWLCLKEDHQIVKGQRRIRLRNFSLCEKRRSGEHPVACAERALEEELRVRSVPVTLIGEEKERSDSRSFRGLQTLYQFHSFEVILPHEAYKPEGYVDRSEEPKETTYFVWSDAS